MAPGVPNSQRQDDEGIESRYRLTHRQVSRETTVEWCPVGELPQTGFVDVNCCPTLRTSFSTTKRVCRCIISRTMFDVN